MIQGDEFLQKNPWKADYNGVQMRHTTWVYWPLCSRRALRSSSRHDGLQMHGRLWTFSSANSGSHGTAELSRVGFTFMFLLNKLSQVWEEHGENGLLLQVYFSRQGMLENFRSRKLKVDAILKWISSWPFLVSLNGCLNWGKEGTVWNYEWIYLLYFLIF